VTPTELSGLDVRKVDAPDPVEAGSHIVYTIYITSTAGFVINNVQVVDVLPSETYYLSSNPVGQYSAGAVTWNIASLNAGASTTLLLELGTYSTFAGIATNSVTASAPGIITVGDSEDTTVVAPPETATPTETRTPAPTATHTATSTATATVPATATATPSRTPTATEVPTLTHTPVAPTATLTASATPLATATATPTGVSTATPTVTRTPTSRRYWIYLPLLTKRAPQLQEHLPKPGLLGWR
jgi:uncharacterized repeat protein (TIGR01451 family)